MISISRLGKNMRRWSRRIRSAMGGLRAADPAVEFLGQTATTALDGFVFCNTFAVLATDVAIRWLDSNLRGPSLASLVTEFPARCLATATLIAVAVYVHARWFPWMRWRRWWALPYVLLILSPGAWAFADRFRWGGYLLLLALQLPVLISYVWCVHVRSPR